MRSSILQEEPVVEYPIAPIAKQEQELGNYKLAHSQLYDTYKELESQGKAPSSELVRNLTLLHSYTLAKCLIRLGDHRGAARMLVRVARSISRFPSHVVQILTSTVVECQRAKLKKTAFEYASMLMRPEYRDQVAPAYKKKIELLVRKPDRDAMVEDEEPVVPCVHCNQKQFFYNTEYCVGLTIGSLFYV